MPLEGYGKRNSTLIVTGGCVDKGLLLEGGEAQKKKRGEEKTIKEGSRNRPPFRRVIYENTCLWWGKG